MNETIGSKGGHNDRRRSLIISKKKKEKLKEEQEIKELEKSVKKARKYVLIKATPLIILDGIIQLVSPSNNQKDEIDESKDEELVYIDDSNKKSNNKSNNAPTKKARKKIISVNGNDIVVSIPHNRKNIKKSSHDEIELLEDEEDKKEIANHNNKEIKDNKKKDFNPVPELMPISIGEKIINNLSSKPVGSSQSSDEMKSVKMFLS